MKTTFLLSAFLVGCITFATGEVRWNQGSLVLANGKVMQGELAFQFSEIVLFRANQEVMVYPAYKVRSFFYYDKVENINRKFLALSSSQQKPATFFEVVVWGRVFVIRNFKRGNFSMRKKSDKYDYTYFVYQPNSLLVELKDFGREVYHNLISHDSRILYQISEQRLNPNEDSDAIRIIKLFNEIATSETLVGVIN